MAELKRTFTTSRMNKDLDERLVPNGEYRDAKNIEILNSDGSDVGSVQTCLGNSMISDLAPSMVTIGGTDLYSSCVGHVTDDKTNKIYYLVSGLPPRSNQFFINLLRNYSRLRPPVANTHKGGHNFISSDIIIEYDSVLNQTLPVMVDIYNVRTELRYESDFYSIADGAVAPPPLNTPFGNADNPNPLYDHIPVVHTSGLRIGMEIEMFGSSTGSPITNPGTIITAIPTDDRIRISQPAMFTNANDQANSGINFGAGRTIVNAFAPRVLNFNKENLITGINIIDDMLFWTDGETEPKKVNITRGKQGTIPGMGICRACVFSPNLENPYTYPGNSAVFSGPNPGPTWLGTTHTELVVEEDVITDYATNGITLNPGPSGTSYGIQEYVKEEHITVIKKSPLSPPKLKMYDTIRRFEGDTRKIHSVVSTDFHDWVGVDADGAASVPPVGMTSIKWNEYNPSAPIAFFNDVADFRTGDILLLTDDATVAVSGSGMPLPFSDDDVKIRLRVISSDSTAENPKLVQSANNGNLEVMVLYMDEAYVTSASATTWYIRLEDKPQSLYELKFPKFAYRYKYEDGEYSSFSPFSETAFLPQKFEYDAVKGYNKGMTNGLKQLFIKDFIPPNIPLDVVEIDILYKESDSPNVYTIRSFNKNDKEWQRSGTGSYKGEFEIKDDLIHAAVASNQLLRPWDNVPRKSLAQEVTGNRIVYGNYIQNYDIKESGNNIDVIKPSFKTVIENSTEVIPEIPETSLKSMRTYQLGIVYKDVYGRETPVLSHPSGSIKVDSSNAVYGNNINVQLDTPHPSWAHSFKYFIKEVSNEYYNLAMDRWYHADYIEYDKDKRAIWLAFPSNDRNKVDEDTTLILKKSEGASSATNSGFVETTPRYKILAIESEAPDFIKTTMEVMGEWDSDTDGAGGIGGFYDNQAAGQLGLPWVNYRQVRIEKDEWEASKFASLQNDNNSILSGSLFDRGSSLVLRVEENVSGGMITQWYNISNISYNKNKAQGNGEEHYIITIDGFFTDDLAPFVGNGVDVADVVSNIRLVIAKKTIENRPEFDGRFFVKIESDGELKEFMGLEGNISSTTNWVTSEGTLSTYFLYGPVDTAIQGASGYANSTFTETTPGTDHGETIGWDITQYPGFECMEGYRHKGQYVTESNLIFTRKSNQTMPSNYPWGGITSYPAPGVNATNAAGAAGSCPNSLAAHAGAHPEFGDQENFSPPYRHKDHWGDLHAQIGSDIRIFEYVDVNAFWAIDSEPAGHSHYNEWYVDPNEVDAGMDIVDGSGTVGPAWNRGIRMAEHGYGADIGKTKISISLFTKFVAYPNPDWIEPFEPHIRKSIDNLSTPGTKFRFANDNDGIVYEIHKSNISKLQNFDYAALGHTGDWWDSNLYRMRFDLDLIEPGTSSNPVPKAIGQQADATFLTGSVNGFANAATYAPCDYSDISGRPSNQQASDSNSIIIEFVTPDVTQNESETVVYSKNPAIWETEPRKDVGLDVYYEVGGAYPVNMCDGSEELYIQAGAKVSMYKSNTTGTWTTAGWFNNQVFTDQIPLAAPPQITSGTTIVNSIHNATSGTANFTHVGGQESSFNQVGGNSNLTLETPIHPALEWALDNAVTVEVSDWTNTFIPANTQIIDSYETIDGSYIITLSNLVPVPNATSVNIPLNSVLKFSMVGSVSPSALTSNVEAKVASVIGCAGPQSSLTSELTTELRLTSYQVLNAGDILLFENPDGTNVTATVAIDSATDTTFDNEKIYLEPLTHSEKQKLNYYNCYTYGNGIESNRIRDLFNAVTIDKGVKASTTLAEQYKEESRSSGMIFSGIYNSMNGVNRLNQFIMAENITKDLNPEHGSIQKLHQRDTDLITLCEDKVLKVLSNKDALFNADDTKNITATQNVLGNAIPFVGEYGISKNPESFAHEGFRAYFTDQERGAVLRLSRDGLTPISEAGMKDWFADNLPNNAISFFNKGKKRLLGSYDRRSDLYNLSIMEESGNHNYEGQTVSFSEKASGWVSFKSFAPETAFSLNSEYYTGKYGWLWKHHDNTVDRNSLYSIASNTLDETDGVINSRSYITVLFNDLPSIIKSFKTLNYEGTQSKVHQNLIDNKHRNQQHEKGWYVSEIITDQQTGTIPGILDISANEWEGEFIEKEGKWFNYIIGRQQVWRQGRTDGDAGIFAPIDGAMNEKDTKELATQGIGFPRSATYTDAMGNIGPI